MSHGRFRCRTHRWNLFSLVLEIVLDGWTFWIVWKVFNRADAFDHPVVRIPANHQVRQLRLQNIFLALKVSFWSLSRSAWELDLATHFELLRLNDRDLGDVDENGALNCENLGRYQVRLIKSYDGY